MPFHGFIESPFLLAPNDTPLSGYISVTYPFTYGSTSWLLPIFGNYEFMNNAAKKSTCRFFVDVNFQLHWVKTKEHDGWIIW